MTRICAVCGREYEPRSWEKFCSDECRRIRAREQWTKSNLKNRNKRLAVYGEARRQSRASGRVYKNTPERLAEIKAKYSRGIPEGEIEAWLS